MNDIVQQVENWILRESKNGEEELYTSDNVAIHSVSNGFGKSRLIKTYTLQNNIKQAVWCSFMGGVADEEKINCICCLDNSNLEVYSENGDIYPIGLPFQVCN